MSDNKANIKKPKNYSNFFERKYGNENKKMIENNMIILKKILQNIKKKQIKGKEEKKEKGQVQYRHLYLIHLMDHMIQEEEEKDLCVENAMEEEQ